MLFKKKHHNFIMIGQGRSGSTLLKQLLDSHPQICCEGELFNVKDNYITNKFIRKIAGKYPITTFYYRLYISRAKVYGFTLLFSQHSKQKYILSFLIKNNWKIIHFYRNDIVQQAFSHLVAVESGLWHRNKNNTTEITQKFLINKDDFFIRIKQLINQKRKELDLLENFSYHTVIYEIDLLDHKHWQKTCDKIFSYLGIESAPVKASLIKTYNRPYAEIVENYDELIDDLANSEYAFLLKDKNHPSILNHK